MFRQNGAPPTGSSFRHELRIPLLPTAPLLYSMNHQLHRGPTSNSHVPQRERLPPYQWNPLPPTISLIPPDKTTLINPRKRQHGDSNTQIVKRQCLDVSNHILAATLQSWIPPHPPRRHQVSANISIPSTGDLNRFGFNGFPTQQQKQVVAESYSNSNIPAPYQKLSGQMMELFEGCQQQAADLERKEIIRVRLQKDIQSIFHTARLYLTGSSMNGLGCRSSDADLCLVIKSNARLDPISILSHLRNLFESLGYMRGIQLIRAKVPILKFREKSSDLEFDLNINNTVGIRNTFLLKSYAHADSRVRPLILVVKKWARHHCINDASKGTLSSYTLVLLVLHYLQTLKDPVLPSLQRDYPACFNPHMDIDVVPDGPVCIPPYKSRNQSSLGELLLGFLRYYAFQFSWDRKVISVREATALPKTNSPEWRRKFICIEEPFERNNVARAVHEKAKFDAIKDKFAESYQILLARKDLDSLLPVRPTIVKETSRK